jgi:hypothetical protein
MVLLSMVLVGATIASGGAPCVTRASLSRSGHDGRFVVFTHVLLTQLVLGVACRAPIFGRVTHRRLHDHHNR